MSQRAAGDVGEDLLHDRMIAVLALGLDQHERGIRADGVIANILKLVICPILIQ